MRTQAAEWGFTAVARALSPTSKQSHSLKKHAHKRYAGWERWSYARKTKHGSNDAKAEDARIL